MDFDADAVDRHEVDVVFEGTHGRNMGGAAPGAFGPVGWQDDEVGPQKRQDAARFGKAAIEADEHANFQTTQIVHFVWLSARRHKAIDAEIGQMGLAIVAYDAIRPQANGTVVEVFAFLFDVAGNGEDIQIFAVLL